jgi:protein-S-isoprenylcysteine O-methyltransferase Ste14
VSLAGVTLVLLNFAVVGLLPLLFFRRGGRLNARWWLTAAPLFAAPLVVLAAAAGLVSPVTDQLQLAAVPLAVLSISLIAYAAGAHQVRIALWHQDADAPEQIVTWGPYRWVRHPFYAAFLLALAGAVLLCPHPATLAAWLYGMIALQVTARREERRLLASPLGASYAAYAQRTGRLWPRLVRRSARAPRPGRRPAPDAAPQPRRSASRPA